MLKVIGLLGLLAMTGCSTIQKSVFAGPCGSDGLPLVLSSSRPIVVLAGTLVRFPKDQRFISTAQLKSEQGKRRFQQYLHVGPAIDGGSYLSAEEVARFLATADTLPEVTITELPWMQATDGNGGVAPASYSDGMYVLSCNPKNITEHGATVGYKAEENNQTDRAWSITGQVALDVGQYYMHTITEHTGVQKTALLLRLCSISHPTGFSGSGRAGELTHTRDAARQAPSGERDPWTLIQPGMIKHEIYSLLGNPEDIMFFDSVFKERWIYPYAYDTQEHRSVTFEQGRVSEVNRWVGPPVLITGVPIQKTIFEGIQFVGPDLP